jgi:hypothetical protein
MIARTKIHTDFADYPDSSVKNQRNPYYYHAKSAKASQIFRVAFGYQCESVCICGSVFLVAASLRQEIRVGILVVEHAHPSIPAAEIRLFRLDIRAICTHLGMTRFCPCT